MLPTGRRNWNDAALFGGLETPRIGTSNVTARCYRGEPMTSEQLMKNAIEAWGRGDLGPLRAAIDDDIVWISASTEWDDRLRSGGVHRGRASVIALLSKVATAFIPSACTAKEIVSSGEIVWGVFGISGRNLGGREDADKTIASELAIRWRVRDGKVLEHQAFFDTAGALAQLGHTGR